MNSVFSIQTCLLILSCLWGNVINDNIKGKHGESEKVAYPNDFSLVGFEPPAFYRSHHQHSHHREFPPNFQHSPEFHRGDPNYLSSQNNKGNDSYSDDDIEYLNETSKYIPIEFINIINQHNISDLLLNYIEEDIILSSRFGESSERNAASIPKAAGCSPEIQTIKLKNTTDPSILYIPQCTKIERCSGCCSHPLLSCQPNKTETITYQVLKTQYNGAKKLKLLGKEVVLIEKHLSCKCDCKIKEEVATSACNKYQQYHQSECRCVCTNTDEEKKCYKNHNKKLWNPDLCACQCRDVFQCSTGQYFDNHECKCVSTPVRRRFATIEPPEAPPVDEDTF